MRRKRGRFVTTSSVPVILDLGHWACKGIVGDDETRRILLPHALIELSREEWHNVVEAGHNRNPDYLQVGSRYYELGETAAGHSLSQAEGTARYTRQYYGTLMCQVIARLFEPNELHSALVFASYPPGDRRHKDELEHSLLGKWDFYHLGREFHLIVHRVATFTEPLGGFWDWIILADDRGHYDNPDYHPDRATLVVDFGGGTMSLLPVDKHQLPDFRKAESFDVGFNDVANAFVRELRATYRDLFRSSRHLPPDLVHEALRTGRWFGGGNEEGMDVTAQVDEAMSELVDEFKTAYQHAGGPMPYGQVILTGGGSAVLGERIKRLLGHQRIFYAHGVLEDMAYANVTGGLKAYREIVGEIIHE